MVIRRQACLENQLRTLWTVGAVGEADDRTLLFRYAASQDDYGEEAFRVLVERHGPMVLSVCWQVIGDRQDAEDATQAVFLVLARKAASIRVEGTIAPWLHGVARRVAAKARCRAATRRQAEIQTAGVAASLQDRAGDGSGVDDWEAIHEEVDRLPERYRSPVVLCYLQGKSYEQAARQIGCPIGTVRVRLSRARERLRSSLGRRGLGPERVTAVAFFLSDPVAVPAPATGTVAEMLSYVASRVEATVKAARALTLGREAMTGGVTATVLELYEGIMRAMIMSRLVSVAAVLITVGVAGAGALVLAAGGNDGQDQVAKRGNQPVAADPSQAKPANEPTVDLDSPETLRKQGQRRVEAARQRLAAQRAYYEEGRITLDRYIEASRELMLAETAVNPTRDGRLAAAKAHWDRMGETQKREREELNLGRGTVADVAEATVAHENAAFDYIAARQSTGTAEIQALRQRIEALEKQIASINKQLTPQGTGKK
jgi:RNA polymerase sigma factor (sigma-70 family)